MPDNLCPCYHLLLLASFAFCVYGLDFHTGVSGCYLNRVSTLDFISQVCRPDAAILMLPSYFFV
jgi:hypothetical protein